MAFWKLLLSAHVDISKGPSPKGILRTFGAVAPYLFWENVPRRGLF